MSDEPFAVYVMNDDVPSDRLWMIRVLTVHDQCINVTNDHSRSDPDQRMLLTHIGTEFRRYFRSPKAKKLECGADGLLYQPWAHLYQSNSVNCMTIAVFRLPAESCTYFVTLHVRRNDSVVLVYAANPDGVPRCLRYRGGVDRYRSIVQNMVERFTGHAFNVARMQLACDIVTNSRPVGIANHRGRLPSITRGTRRA